MALPGVLALPSAAVATIRSHSNHVASMSCATSHRAKPNDSWTRIAARFNVPLKRLLTLNNATVNSPIFVGDRLCLAAVIQPSSQPDTTTAPAPSVPQQTYTRKEVTAIIREVWPDELEETALVIARRESNLVPRVVGGKNDCCVGLFQIYWTVHRSWLAEMGITEAEELLDPRVNAEAALRLYRRNGNSWRPWWTSSWRP